MPGMCAQPGVIDLFNQCVLIKEFRNLSRVLCLSFNSKIQSFETPLKKTAGRGVKTAAEMRRLSFDPACQSPVGQNCAAAYITVSTQVFGSAVKHNIDTQFQRILIDRRSEGIVDSCRDAVLFPNQCRLTYIDNTEKGVRWRFNENQPCIVPDSFSNFFCIRGYKSIINTDPFKLTAHKCMGPSVQFILQDDVITLFQKGKDGCCDCRHTRTEQHSIFSVLQIAQFSDHHFLIRSVKIARIRTLFQI